MNFLAHQYLSYLNPNISIGNFLADFIRGNDIEDFSKEIQDGVLWHREIDRFTDTHPLVEKAVDILAQSQGRYASVIIDIYFDYFLANNWSQFCSVSLKSFTEKLYPVFRVNKQVFPEKVQPAIHSLVTHDWFFNYQYKDGIEKALYSIVRRASFENNLEQALDDLFLYKNEIEPLFLDFFPQLIERSKTYFNEHQLVITNDYTL